MARCGHAPMLTAVPVGRFGVQNPEIPVQVDLDTGAVGPGDQHAVGGGAFAGLGLDFSGGAAAVQASGPVTSSSPSNAAAIPDPAPMPIAAAATAETPNCTMRFIAFS